MRGTIAVTARFRCRDRLQSFTATTQPTGEGVALGGAIHAFALRGAYLSVLACAVIRTVVAVLSTVLVTLPVPATRDRGNTLALVITGLSILACTTGAAAAVITAFLAVTVGLARTQLETVMLSGKTAILVLDNAEQIPLPVGQGIAVLILATAIGIGIGNKENALVADTIQKSSIAIVWILPAVGTVLFHAVGRLVYTFVSLGITEFAAAAAAARGLALVVAAFLAITASALGTLPTSDIALRVFLFLAELTITAFAASTAASIITAFLVLAVGHAFALKAAAFLGLLDAEFVPLISGFVTTKLIHVACAILDRLARRVIRVAYLGGIIIRVAHTRIIVCHAFPVLAACLAIRAGTAGVAALIAPAFPVPAGTGLTFAAGITVLTLGACSTNTIAPIIAAFLAVTVGCTVRGTGHWIFT